MSIKCKELTESNTSYELSKQVIVKRAKEGSYIVNPKNYTRIQQVRKRSLTSMGWIYHV